MWTMWEENVFNLELNKNYDNFYNARLRRNPQLLQRKLAEKILKFDSVVTWIKHCTFWNVKYVVRLLMLEKLKLSLDKSSITMKANKAFRKGNRKILQKVFHDHYCLDGRLGIDDWDFTPFEQCETHKQLKERAPA